MIVLNYGGGRQTIAICVLIERGVLPLPDIFLMADTARENPSTWAYLATYVQPMLAALGRNVTVIPPKFTPKVTYGAEDKPMIPAFSRDASGVDGKFGAFCTGTWKRDRMTAWLTENKIDKGERWVGFSHDEQRRIKRLANSEHHNGWDFRFPLNELLITATDCIAIVRKRFGVDPPISSCWMCPQKKNAEWRDIRDNHPSLWEQACVMDEELRDDDLFRGGGGIWLHHSRTPLRTADLSIVEDPLFISQCSLGMCYV